MRARPGAILNEVPTRDDWVFGCYRYGVEPLTLPHAARFGEPAAQDAADVTATATAKESACLRLLTISARGTTNADHEPPVSRDELFWFRWITGHQVSFILWQLMAHRMRRFLDGDMKRDLALESLHQYAHGYCGMLLYTGTCPQEVYERVIRPSMYRQHRGFSGVWAPDFKGVRDLFRGKPLPFERDDDADRLVGVLQLSQRIHAGIAAKLVPEGRSLLQDSYSAAQGNNGDVLGVMFDNYFMTLRGPVSAHDVVAQLLRRLIAIAEDVVSNGFAMGPEERERLPEELRDPAVAECEDNLPTTLFSTAALAAGLDRRDVAAQLEPGGRLVSVPGLVQGA